MVGHVKPIQEGQFAPKLEADQYPHKVHRSHYAWRFKLIWYVSRKLSDSMADGVIDPIVVDKSRKFNGQCTQRQVYPRTWWVTRKEITGPLMGNFASSLATSKAPEAWRILNITHLCKGIKYKPVGKLLKNILRERIYVHMKRILVIGRGGQGMIK